MHHRSHESPKRERTDIDRETVTDTPAPHISVTPVRVRYVECDPMGLAHHAMYPVWFEIGRTELLREAGIDYRDLEAADIFLAVVSLHMRFKQPARYDDELLLETTLASCGQVKIEHTYRLMRGKTLLTTGQTMLACIDRGGKLQPVPEILLKLWE